MRAHVCLSFKLSIIGMRTAEEERAPVSKADPEGVFCKGLRIDLLSSSRFPGEDGPVFG